MWKKLKNNGKKGFTLVELIVVLVILAILAALLIPALTGYIDKAKEKDLIAKTRQIVMASQTLLDEAYAEKTTSTTEIEFANDAAKADNKITIGINKPLTGKDDITTVQGLSEVKDLSSTNVKITVGGATNGSGGTNGKAGKIYEVKYMEDGKICTYTDNGTGYVVTVGDSL